MNQLTLLGEGLDAIVDTCKDSKEPNLDKRVARYRDAVMVFDSPNLDDRIAAGIVLQRNIRCRGTISHVS